MTFIKDGKVVRENESKKPIWLIDSVNMTMIMRGEYVQKVGSEIVTMKAGRRYRVNETAVEKNTELIQRWVVEKVQDTGDAVFVFMAEIKAVPSLMTGAIVEARVTRSDGRVEKLGNYRVPHDSVYADPDGMGQELLHEIARQDPLPIVKIVIANVADGE